MDECLENDLGIRDNDLSISLFKEMSPFKRETNMNYTGAAQLAQYSPELHGLPKGGPPWE